MLPSLISATFDQNLREWQVLFLRLFNYWGLRSLEDKQYYEQLSFFLVSYEEVAAKYY